MCWIWGLNLAKLHSNMWWHYCGVVNRDVLKLFPLHIRHKPEQDPLSFFQLTLKSRSFYSNMLFEWLNESQEIQLRKLRNPPERNYAGDFTRWQTDKRLKSKMKTVHMALSIKEPVCTEICSLVLLFEQDQLTLTWEQFDYTQAMKRWFDNCFFKLQLSQTSL